MVENGENPILSHYFLPKFLKFFNPSANGPQSHLSVISKFFFNFAVILSHIIGYQIGVSVKCGEIAHLLTFFVLFAKLCPAQNISKHG
jgi:hypothetical protein